jgi:hypothetical protein
MRLDSPHISSQSYPSPADVRAAFAALERAGLDCDPFVILEDASDFASGYLQALRTAAGYCAEMRHGGTDRHYRTKSLLSLDQAVALFLAFLETGVAVLDRWDWDDVTEAVNRQIGVSERPPASARREAGKMGRA